MGGGLEVREWGPERGAVRAIDANRLVEAHLADVARVAKEFRRFGIPMEDLQAEGAVGLLEAASRFDPRRGVKFMSYATWWIRKRIRDIVMRQISLVRLPRYRLERLRRVRTAERALAAASGARPTIEEIAKQAGIASEEVSSLLGFSRREVSLDDLSSAETGQKVGETVAQRLMRQPDAALMEEDASSLLAETMESLPEREREILTMRYGLDGDRPLSLAEIGRRFQISRERVRQLETGALKRMRQKLHAGRCFRSPR